MNGVELKEKLGQARILCPGMEESDYQIAEYIATKISDTIGDKLVTPNDLSLIVIRGYLDINPRSWNRVPSSELPEFIGQNRKKCFNEMKFFLQILDVVADRDLAEIVRDECRDCYMWDVVHMVVVADDEEYPDYVKAALDWWSARIQRRVRGSGWNRELIKEELASFRAALAQRIMEEIGRSGAAKLNIDIDPTDRMLLDAAETIGIDAWDLLDVFPRRTSMCVTKTCVKVRIGSQRKYSVIWGNDE